MAKRLRLHGRVQGVFCRAYCSQYARLLKIHGAASNLADGTVQVFLNIDDPEMIRRYVSYLINNPKDFTFYGRIESVEEDDYSGSITGDYQF
ncbi:MAG: hypothetical protein A2W19_06035 [Spirochaetes bacterium RBG_16_49_21]|nr:MAG: hypothetical protein A2W19_06035 [Spirochaetes bacterium RBG_16_49_21]